MKVAVTGSSGLIGTALAEGLRADGHEVVRLVRHAPRASDELRWDPRAVDAGLNGTLAGIDACVNLAGAPVSAHRWTRSYKAEIRSSRVLATQALASALTRLEPRPSVFVCASAIGWYGDTSGRPVDESAPSGRGFLAEAVVPAWEAACAPASDAGIRVVNLRSGLVLSRRGGLLDRMLPLARLGLLPRLGTGSQVMSWISLADEIAAIRFLMDSGECSGPYNLTAPGPVTNDEFTSALEHACRRPDLRWLRVPDQVLRIALGEMSSEILSSAQVIPKRLTEAGFSFSYPEIGPALSAVLHPPQ